MVSIVDSLAAPLSLINALVVALCLKRPDTVKESLESLEGAWIIIRFMSMMKLIL